MNRNSISFASLLLNLSYFSAQASPASSCSQTAEVHQPTGLSSAEGCLLAQRTHLAVVESLGESETFHSIARHSLTNRLSQRMSMTVDSSARLNSQQMQWLAVKSALPEILAQLEDSRLEVSGHLETLIDKFIDKQAGSDDACHAKLFEAKHQLNQLHEHVHDLATEVNATDHQVTALNSQVESKLKEHDDLEAKCNEDLAAIETKKQEDLDKLTILKNEMQEMKQMANPNVSMNMANNTIIGGFAQLGLREFLREPVLPEAASLMQIGAKEVTSEREEPGNLFDPLQMAMVDVAQCMDVPRRPRHRRASSVALKQAAPNSTLPARRTILCSVNDTVNIKIGDAEKEVSPKRGMADNENSTVACSYIDSKLAGAIWLNCDGGDLTADLSLCIASGNSSNATKCAEEKEKLVETFVKVYVDLAREIHALEEETTDGHDAEEDAKEKQCDDQKKPIQADAAKAANLASEKIKDLEELRPRLEDSKDAETKLREQVKNLNDECALIPNATSDLNKVREAIKALSLCPGLTAANLSLPTFVGSYIEFGEDLTKIDDAEIDKRMTAACQAAFGANYADKTVVPATVAELAQNSIHELNMTNAAAQPLLGMCPQCGGDADTAFVSGHARVCWDAGANLTLGTQRRDCGTPPFSVACVVIAKVDKP